MCCVVLPVGTTKLYIFNVKQLILHDSAETVYLPSLCLLKVDRFCSSKTNSSRSKQTSLKLLLANQIRASKLFNRVCVWVRVNTLGETSQHFLQPMSDWFRESFSQNFSAYSSPLFSGDLRLFRDKSPPGAPFRGRGIHLLHPCSACWLFVSGPPDFRLVIQVLFGPRMFLNACARRRDLGLTSHPKDVALPQG